MLSVGCGWHPGRHLFGAPAWRMTGVDVNADMVETLLERGEIDAGLTARAGELPFEPASFDVVLYRLVLHHVAYQQPLGPVFDEAARLLRPGGALVVIEPGRGTRSARRSRWPTAPGWACGRTAHPTTSRSPRGRWRARPRPRASTPSCTP